MSVRAPDWLGLHRVDLAECGSTNDEAARLARAGARHGTIVVAASQRAGRGRDGRVWASPPGGLYVSAVVRPPLPITHVPPMTLAIGVGLCDAARAHGAPAELKWPNDALVAAGGRWRKLAGVLVEAQTQGRRLDAVIVGIGVNLATSPEVGGGAPTISLAEACGAEAIDRDAFLATLLAHVEIWLDRYVASGLPVVASAWQARMARGLVARATVDGAPRTGDVIGLDGDGALLVRDATGTHRVRAGDVAICDRPC